LSVEFQHDISRGWVEDACRLRMSCCGAMTEK
jgi:hypothetical protein